MSDSDETNAQEPPADGQGPSGNAQVPPEERFAEPDPEPDPEADLPDPETELPSVPEGPEVEIPEVTVSEAEVPESLLKDFWTTVLVINVAVLAVSVGAMMVVFDVYRLFGAAVFALGLFSGLRGYRKYRAMDAEYGDDE